MKRNIILAALALSIGIGAPAQSDTGGASGYLSRAARMMADCNYVGAIDQAARAMQLPMSADERVQAECMRACAMVHTDTDRAIPLLERFLADHPGSVWSSRAAMALGDCYYGADYDRALLYYGSVNAEALDPAERDTLKYRMACCLLKSRNYDTADMLYAELARSREYGKAAWFYRGYISYVRGRYADALAQLKKSDTASEPGNMSPYYISQCYYMLHDYKNALAEATLADKLTAPDADYHAEMLRVAGESAYHLGYDKQARAYMQQYAGLVDVPNPSAAYLLGLYAYGDGDFAQAEQYLQCAAPIDDAMGQAASLYIGLSQMHRGEIDDALLAFDRALNMDYDPEVKETAYYNYAVAAQKGARLPFGNTVDTFEHFLKLYPGSAYAPQAQQYVVAAYINDRKYEQALSSINAMRRPTDETLQAKQLALYMLGAQALGNAQYDRAIELLTEQKKNSRYNQQVALESQLLLGEAYYGAGKPAQAMSQLQAYVKSAKKDNGNVPLAYYDLGYAYFAEKKYQQAAEAFGKMMQAPGALGVELQADASNRRGDSYYYAHDFESAAEAYDRAYELNRAAGDYSLLQKGLMEGYQRRHQRKIEMLDRLEREFPQSPLIPDALLEKTESYIQLGHNDRAIEVYRSLVSRYPNTSQGRQGALQMALTMLNDGRGEEAKGAYRDVITRYPSSEEAAQAAEELKRLYAAEGRAGEFMAFINSVPNAPRMDADEADLLSFEAAEKEYITKDVAKLLELYVREYPRGNSRAKALAYLMEYSIKHDDDAKAYQYASELAQKYPDHASAQDALLLMAEADEDGGDMQRALIWWHELADKASSPRMLNASRMGIARCGIASEAYDEALTATDALLQSAALTTEQRTEAEFMKGAALAATGRTESARDAWSQAAEHLSSPHGIQAAYRLAQSWFDDDNLGQAELWGKKITGADTDQQYWVARAFILLSDVYARQGNDFKSQQYLKSLKDNYPGSEQDIFEMIDIRTKK